MPLLHTLQDNFDSGVLSTAWTNWGTPQVALANRRLEITTALSANYYGMDSTVTYDLTGSYAIVEVINAGNQGLASYEAYPVMLLKDANNNLAFLITGNTLYAYKKVATVGSLLTSVAWIVNNFNVSPYPKTGYPFNPFPRL